MKPILVVGSVNLDMVASSERIPAPGETLIGNRFETFFGGKGANQAVGVARLGYPVSMIAKVGDDEIGERLRRGLHDAGVNARGITAAAQTSSGVALITTDSRGQNSIVVVPGANGRLLPMDVERFGSLLANAGMILMQLEVPLETVVYVAEMGYRKKIPVMLDPAPARDLPPKLLLQLSWLTPNESETLALCGSSPAQGSGSLQLDPTHVRQHAEDLLGRGPRHVILKLGSQGAYLASRNGEREYIPAFKVRAVDSTAAGDAFNAALAVALLEDKPAAEAARYASAVAAVSVTRKGAQPSMPDKAEVTRFLKTAKLQAVPGFSSVENAAPTGAARLAHTS